MDFSGAKSAPEKPLNSSVSHKRKPMSNLDKYKEDLALLVMLGQKMELDLTFRYLRDQGELKEKDEESAKKIKG